MISLNNLSYAQTLELLEQALEIYRYEEAGKSDPADIVHEIIDNWLPVYNKDIREQWVEANCPEPWEICSFEDARDMHHAMQLGLYEVAFNQLIMVMGQAENMEEAANAISADLSLLTEA